LKPGFRHVFCAVDDGAYWVMFDARDGKPVVQVVQASAYDLAGFYRSKGYTVVETGQGQPLRGPFAVANCVGLCKAICAIRAPFALTPFQLFKHLMRKRP